MESASALAWLALPCLALPWLEVRSGPFVFCVFSLFFLFTRRTRSQELSCLSSVVYTPAHPFCPFCFVWRSFPPEPKYVPDVPMSLLSGPFGFGLSGPTATRCTPHASRGFGQSTNEILVPYFCPPISNLHMFSWWFLTTLSSFSFSLCPLSPLHQWVFAHWSCQINEYEFPFGI